MINDPDWRIMDAAPSSFTKGVQIGSKGVSFPRTPAVYERKVKWRKYDDTPLGLEVENYSGAKGIEQTLE